MIPVPDDFWPLLYTNRARAIPVSGVLLHPLGTSHIEGTNSRKARKEAVVITRISFTVLEELTPEDAGACGLLGAGELEKELRRQNPQIEPNSPVTLVYFRRQMEDR